VRHRHRAELFLELKSALGLAWRDRANQRDGRLASSVEACPQPPRGQPDILPRPDRRDDISAAGGRQRLLDHREFGRHAVELAHRRARAGEHREPTTIPVQIGNRSCFPTSGASLIRTPAAGTADEPAAFGAPAEDFRHTFKLKIA